MPDRIPDWRENPTIAPIEDDGFARRYMHQEYIRDVDV